MGEKKLKNYSKVSRKTIEKNAKYLVEKDSPYHDIRDLVNQVSVYNKNKKSIWEMLADSLKAKAKDYDYSTYPLIDASMGEGFDAPSVSYLNLNRLFTDPQDGRESLRDIFDQRGMEYHDMGDGLYSLSGKDPKGGAVADMMYQALSEQSYADYPESRIPFATPSSNKSIALKDLPTFIPRSADIKDIIKFLHNVPNRKK